jgi:DnaJ like chaperone protein
MAALVDIIGRLFRPAAPGGEAGPGESPAPAGGAPRVLRGQIAAALIALSAKMAKADGVVTPEEVVAFREVFRGPSRAARHAGRLFDLARGTTRGFEAYARRVARRWRANPALLEDVLDGLFHIAKADGAITADEAVYLERVAEIFGFSEREFRRIRASHGALEAADPYLILGVDPDISDADLRVAWRRMAAQNHPDALVARGAPPELRRLAEEKMAAINAAYQVILQERGLARPAGD